MTLPQIALRRPLSVLVAAIAVGIASVAAWRRIPQDILPAFNLPTIYVAQAYGGMDPAQMEGYLVYFFEYHFLYLTGIEHVESKSIQGAALMKLQFHPGTDMSQAMAETVAYVNRARAFMPPGTLPPLITRFDAGSAPVGYLVFSSATRPVREVQDAALNRVRPLLATLPGVSAPPPLGGNARSIVVSLKPDRLKSYRMSPDEVVEGIAAANVVSPSGNLMMAGKYPMVPVNSVAEDINELAATPVRGGMYPAVFVRDVADVKDDSDIVTGYALINGQRAVYIPITPRPGASAVSVAAVVKKNLGKFQDSLPAGITVGYQLDQSPIVTRTLNGLLWEGLLGAVLIGLTIIFFLRDWRSAVVLFTSIPLSLMAAVLVLWLAGQRLNLVTLGGMVLAVGILADEAIVTLENIRVQLGRGVSIAEAALDATNETAAARFLAMLCVLVMFTPGLFLTGIAKAMFMPLALAVGSAMAASYVLSSALVPVLAVWLSRGREAERSEKQFGRLREVYGAFLRRTTRRRGLLLLVYVLCAGTAIVFIKGRLGTELFPGGHTRELQVRLRAPAGTDIDGTEAVYLRVLKIIENTVGSNYVESSLGFVGLHGSMYPINFLYQWDGGTEEGVLHVRLKDGTRRNVDAIKESLRQEFAARMPEVSFTFEPADLEHQVMGLGAAPIEVSVSGPNLAADRAFAENVKTRMEKISMLRDVQFAQSLDYPTMQVNVDRERAGIIGPTIAQVSRALVPATWSSRFEVPNYWADPSSGVGYQVQVEVPQHLMSSLEDVGNLPVMEQHGKSVLLRNVAQIREGTAPSQYDRYNMQRTITVRANITGEDLGGAARTVDRAIAESGAPPERVHVSLAGQIAPMRQLQAGLQFGLMIAVIAIFLLLMAYFQSFKLSVVAVSTVPAVLAGVGLALWLTKATLNIDSLMGLIMSVGVAVANAILVVTFAERARVAGATAEVAAMEAARSRLRPILMTSVAMIAGMLPVAIGLVDKSGQMASLARAVIGGLAAATVATLFVLPSVFSVLQSSSHRRGVSLEYAESSNPDFPSTL
jgi:multidrug efflux pump subunit AcrB